MLIAVDEFQFGVNGDRLRRPGVDEGDIELAEAMAAGDLPAAGGVGDLVGLIAEIAVDFRHLDEPPRCSTPTLEPIPGRCAQVSLPAGNAGIELESRWMTRGASGMRPLPWRVAAQRARACDSGGYSGKNRNWLSSGGGVVRR